MCECVCTEGGSSLAVPFKIDTLCTARFSLFLLSLLSPDPPWFSARKEWPRMVNISVTLIHWNKTIGLYSQCLKQSRMTKMLQGVSCHFLTPPHLITHCNLHQVGKKKEKQTIKWRFPSILLCVIWKSCYSFCHRKPFPCEHQLIFSAALLSQAH